jgi:hypothetical protein
MIMSCKYHRIVSRNKYSLSVNGVGPVLLKSKIYKRIAYVGVLTISAETVGICWSRSRRELEWND